MIPEPEEFRAEARDWLATVARPRPADGAWGTGDDSVAVFENWSEDEEREHTERIRSWERTRFDQAWGALSWPRLWSLLTLVMVRVLRNQNGCPSSAARTKPLVPVRFCDVISAS